MTVLLDPDVAMLFIPTILMLLLLGVAVPLSAVNVVGTEVDVLTVTVLPDPVIEIPVPFAKARELSTGVAVPDGVVKEVGIAGCSVTSKSKVIVLPLPEVSIPVIPPKILKLFAEGVAVPESVAKESGTEESAFMVTVLPDPLLEQPVPPNIVSTLRAGVAVPESVATEVGIAGCSVTSKLMVIVLPLPTVSMPFVPPKTFKIFPTGTAVPLSVTKEVGTDGVLVMLIRPACDMIPQY